MIALVSFHRPGFLVVWRHPLLWHRTALFLRRKMCFPCSDGQRSLGH